MKNKTPKFKVAVVQAAPVLFKLSASVKKACDLIQETSKKGAELVLFPEAFIPAYPRGLTFGTVVGNRSDTGRDLWQIYWENSVDIPGLKPTGAERIIWGEGDGSTLTTLDTPLGVIGGLICWENYMPLARNAMYRKGVQVYLAPTADQRETWQSTLRHIACEGRCFVLGCNQYVTKKMYPSDLPGIEDLDSQPEILSRGGSVIISPFGEILSGPLFDQEGILYADIDLTEVSRSKMDFDVVGHYARPDVFEVRVKDQPETIKIPPRGK
ncbi:MAG: carbon-nitrogen hydrolase family protein [Calditrichota bacterium]